MRGTPCDPPVMILPRGKYSVSLSWAGWADAAALKGPRMFDPLPTGPRLPAPSKVPAAEPTPVRAAGFAGFLTALEGTVRTPPHFRMQPSRPG